MGLTLEFVLYKTLAVHLNAANSGCRPVSGQVTFGIIAPVLFSVSCTLRGHTGKNVVCVVALCDEGLFFTGRYDCNELCRLFVF
jgi:hypothetical protein